MKRLLFSVLCFGATIGMAEAQSGAFQFNRGGDQITINRESQWRNWIYQNNLVREVQSPMDSTGLFDFSSFGIRPKYFAASQNYVLNRSDFSYVDDVRFRGLNVTVEGEIQGLSNPADAAKIGDGDINTYWQPANADFNADGLRNWQLLVDLGRAVFSDSVVVQFPPIESGGQETVPAIPTDAEATSDLTPELQASIRSFARLTSLIDILAPADLLDEAGAVVVASGDTVTRAGAQLPGTLSGIRIQG